MSHAEFVKRYGRLGPRELAAPSRGDAEMEAITCANLANSLLIRNRHDPDPKSKYEVGKTKIFIRCVQEVLEQAVLMHGVRDTSTSSSDMSVSKHNPHLVSDKCNVGCMKAKIQNTKYTKEAK